MCAQTACASVSRVSVGIYGVNTVSVKVKVEGLKVRQSVSDQQCTVRLAFLGRRVLCTATGWGTLMGTL
jgi:hypothetical protein